MATHSSAIKRHKQSLKRRKKNVVISSGLKTAVKKVREAVREGKADEAKAHLVGTVRLLDKAVTSGILHRNNASRRISHLTKAVNSIKM